MKSHFHLDFEGRVIAPARRVRSLNCWVVAAILFVMQTAGSAWAAQSQWVYFGAGGTLVYSNDNLGNHIPDFSFAGYGGGGVALPNAPVAQTLSPVAGDNTASIQNAINAVSGATMVNGLRGAVLLNPGTYEMDGSLTLSANGVVLRGSGSSTSGTVLHFIGASRQCITVQGSGATSQQGGTYTITDNYVALGATNFDVNDASSFAVGNLIVVQRPQTQSWIDAIGMNLLNNPWTPGSGLHFERTIMATNGNRITIDIPLCNPIERAWTTGNVYRVTDSGRMTNSGIENLRIRSDFADFSTNWGKGRAMNIDDAKNCWVQNVIVDHFYNGINDGGGAKWCTIQDCFFVSNAVPPSSAGSAAFGGGGALILYQRCGSSNSTDYHTFVTQASTPGPYVVLNHNSIGTGYDSGAHQRWAAGILFDHDTVASTSGNTGIKLQDRGNAGSGQGYGAGFSIIYNGNSQGIINEIPQVTNHYNWVIGGVGSATHYSDDGIYDNFGSILSPQSLYLEQLRERLGPQALVNIGYGSPDFTVSAQPATDTVFGGDTNTYNVQIGSLNGFTNEVDLEVSGLPADTTASFNPGSVNGSGVATLSVVTSNATPPGVYALEIIGTNGSTSLVHTTSVSLVVLAFNLSATPGSQMTPAGSNATYTVTVATNDAYAGNISFGLAGLPASSSASFNPSFLSGAGTSTLTVTTTSNAPGGNYALSISGTNGGLVGGTGVSLIVSGSESSPGILIWTSNSGTDTNWSTVLNWTNLSAGGFGPPGTSNAILYTNLATVGASALTSPGSGVVVPAKVNSYVDGSFSIIGLTNLANAVNTSPVYHNLDIASGATLQLNGNMQVGGYSEYLLGDNSVVNLSVSGAGGTLLVTNNGGIVVSEDAASGPGNNATLDLSGLDNLIVAGAQILIGIEGSGSAHHASGVLYLARTNLLTLASAGYDNNDASGSPYGGHPALYIGHNGSDFGSGSQLYLGVSNRILVDYALVGRGDTNALMAFNPAFLSANPSVYIRGTNGAVSRVGVYVVGDGSAGAQANNAPSTNDFTGGNVDALMNYLCVGRGREGNSSTVGASGILTFNQGNIYANTMAIGFLYPNGSNSVASGTVNVNGGVLTIASNLTLAARSSVGGSGSAQGTLNLNGGTVQATNIIGGGGLSTINLNSGTLDLQGANPRPGQIANVSALNIGANAVGNPALLANAASVSAVNPILIASNGTLSGNTLVTAPGLTVNGAIAPGQNGPGWITNNGPLNLGPGGQYTVLVQDAGSGPVSGWSFVQVNGGINVQASGASPFTITLDSLSTNGSGPVSDFNNNTNYEWLVASAGGGITNFDAGDFDVNNALFANDLAGGFFFIRTNAASLVLSFTNNHPPFASTAVYYVEGPEFAIPLSNLSLNWSDPDGDPVILLSLNSSSTNGQNNVSTDGANIYYANSNGLPDAFQYTVQDARTNPPAIYRPDDTIRTAVGTVVLLPPAPQASVSLSGTNLILSGSAGPSGGTCYLLTSTNIALRLTNWMVLSTNSFDWNGNMQTTIPIGSIGPRQFYILQAAP